MTARRFFRLLVMLAAVRTVAFLAHAWIQFNDPLEAYYLESKMVSFAWRVQEGHSLYPDWRDGQHPANFFAPLYFWLVGFAGRFVHSSLDGLFSIGRGASFGAYILGSVALGLYIGRKYGGNAGFIAGLLSFATPAALPFAVLTRPDNMATTLGLIGYLGVAIGGWHVTWASVVLSAAVLTKQTAFIFLAAAVALAAYRRNWRDASRVLLLSTTLIGAVVAIVSLAIEPNFARNLVGEAVTTWRMDHWLAITVRITVRSPGTILLPLLGVAAFRGRPKDDALTTLATILLPACVVSAAKFGSDLNYFLPLGYLEGWVLARTWVSMRRQETEPGRQRSTAMAIVYVLIVFFSLPVVLDRGLRTPSRGAFWKSPEGRAFLRQYRGVYFRWAENPHTRLLTDSGVVALRQRERAPFVDPWLFHMLVDDGRLKPNRLREQLAGKRFEIVLLSARVDDPDYPTYSFALPEYLAKEVRRSYRFVGMQAGLFIHVPKRDDA